MPTYPVTSSDVSFSTQFTLNTNPDKIIWVDLSDWTALAIATSGVKVCFKVTSPSNVITYNNTDFTAPDITRGSSATSTTTVPIPNLGNGAPEAGEYEITATYQIIDGSNPTYTVQKTYTYDFQYAAPEVDIYTEVDCISPLILGIDQTDYVVENITPTINRTFVFENPTGSGGTDITNTTSATITTSTFYTGPNSFTVTSILTYVFDDDLIVVDTVSGSKVETVDCSLICNLYCCLRSLNRRMDAEKGVNDSEYNSLKKTFEEVMSKVELLMLAIDCGKQQDVNTYTSQIQELADCTSDCNCNDGTPRRVTGLGIQNVNVAVQSGGAPVVVSSSVAGGITTYTVSLSSSFVNTVNGFTTSVVAGTAPIVVTPVTVGSVTTYTVSTTISAQNRQEFICRLQPANFAVPQVTITNSAYLYSGSNMAATNTITATDIANPNWALMNNLYTCTGFQVSGNNNYKVTANVVVEGADYTLAGGAGTWTSTQMAGLYDQLQFQIVEKASGTFKFRLVSGAGGGVGIPLSNKMLVIYPDIKLFIKISE